LTITHSTDAPTAPIDSAAPDGEAAETPAERSTPDGAAAGAVTAHAAEGEVDGAALAAEMSATAEATAPAAAEDGDDAPAEAPPATPAGQAKPKGARAPRSASDRQSNRRPANPAAGGSRDRRTTAQRLGNFPRADKPAQIPAPEHHHLPGWVRRDFARARPPLSNILALLEGEVRDEYAKRIDELTEGISAGRFSLAWQYPDLVDEGRVLYEKQRREHAESARTNRQLDTARRRVQDRIRDAADQLTADVAARLQRQLRSANDQEAINAVAAELDGVATAARSTADKRREREIERTRTRIMRSAAAAGAADATPHTETWQDVLRRFAEQQAAGSRSSE
jgi:hypothetical protein